MNLHFPLIIRFTKKKGEKKKEYLFFLVIGFVQMMFQDFNNKAKVKLLQDIALEKRQHAARTKNLDLLASSSLLFYEINDLKVKWF